MLELVAGEWDPRSASDGIFRCNCHEYPIVEGIPILQQLEGLDRVLQSIRNRQPQRALLQALRVFRVRWAHRSRVHELRYLLDCRRLLASPAMTFEHAAQLVRKPKIFADYLVHRFANPSFLAAIGPMSLLGNAAHPGAAASARVLDLACGAGHASFLIKLLHPDLTVISADQDFVSLYLAKRFVTPDSIPLCWDVESPSPLPDAWLDGVFCLDAFHYFKGKKAAIGELKRVSSEDAIWLFPHLHNGTQRNLVPGIPMSPEGYLDCFGFSDGHLLDERALLSGLARTGTFVSETSVPWSQIRQAPALTYLRTPSPAAQPHDSFWRAFCRDRTTLAINPIYKRRWHGEELHLQLVWPNRTIAEECASVTAVLPAECRVHRDALLWLIDPRREADEDRLFRLVGEFVFVPLPPGYSANDVHQVLASGTA